MEKFLFSADQHGNIGQYKKLFEAAADEQVDVVILGGDLTPKDPARRTPPLQRKFLKVELFPLISAFKADSQADVLLIMGNDDYISNYDFVKNHQQSVGYHLIDDRGFVSKNGYVYWGYSYVPYSPFKDKDWERRDLESHKCLADRPGNNREDGVMAIGDELVSININDAMMQNSIEQDLFYQTKNFAKDKLVTIIHAPPYKTVCDLATIGEHVGSQAVRKFIEQQQPLLTLHGHIHETVDMSGDFQQKIGKTICASAGNDHIPDAPFCLIGSITDNLRLERTQLT